MRNYVSAALHWNSVSRSCAAFGVLFVMLVTVSGTFAADWPQWRGPNRDGISKETGLAKEWPKEGPKLHWQVADLGDGYSTPAIVGGRLYVLSNKGTDDEFVQARNVSDGKEIWSIRLGKVGNPNQQPNYAAARSTPTVDGDVLYALGSDGDLACLEVSQGKVRWQKNLRTDFQGKPGTWAYSESPLIDGDALICTPGGSEATLVSLNKKSGEVIWKCPLPEGDEAAYASAILVQTAGTRQCVQLVQKGLVGVDARTGNFLWRYSKPVSRFNANIPTPVAGDGFVYAGSAGTGGGAVKLIANGGGVTAEQVYFDVKMPTAIGGAVKIGDYLYGTTAQALLCIEFATGNVKWQERALGAAAICCADGRLYLHGESGEVALIEPSPESYREKGRFTPPDQPKHANPMEKAWAYPAIADGRLYIRDRGTLWCYAVK
jgi:outer membrane protein assembly factor BamB